MDNRKIGLFDSGLGGLTVMKELMRLLPTESVVYFGDTGRIPYGSKSADTVIKYAKSDINFLKTFDLKVIIAACGTASSIALPKICDLYDIPVLGVIDATARAAAKATKNGKVGVIGTAGTIRSDAYGKAITAINPAIKTTSAACPLFVSLVESGFAEKEAAELVAREYLDPILKSGADTLILGCTHYPLLSRVIGNIMGESVTLINPGVCLAEELKERLAAQDMLASVQEEEPYRFYVSDVPEDFVRLGSMFLERPLSGHVQQIDIEKYN